MFNKFLTPIILTILLTGILVCGAVAQNAEAKKIVPSRFLNQTDAEKIVGETLVFRGDQTTGAGDEFVCVYTAELGRVLISAKFEPFEEREAAKAMFRARRALSEAFRLKYKNKYPTQTEILQNTGDEAWLESGADSRIVYVRKNNMIFELNVSGEALQSSSLTELKRIAAQIAGQI